MIDSVIAGKTHVTHTMIPKVQSGRNIPCLNCFLGNKSKIVFLITLVCIICSYTGLRWYATAKPEDDVRDLTTVVVPDNLTVHKTSGTTFPLSNSSTITQTKPQVYEKRLPHFIIIGVKKSGTRALLSFIKMHPDIVTTGMEVHFFDRNESYEQGLDWYRDMMPASLPDQLTGEKSPGYYRTLFVPQRIHEMNSSIKLILVVREPIERCMSNYLQHASKNARHGSFASEVLLSNGEVNEQSPHVFNSNYDLFIDMWLKRFPRKQLKIVDGNLLITHPHLVLQEVQEFLGVRQYINEEFFQYDEKKGFYCYFNESEFKCLGDSKGRAHPEISPAVKLKLYQYFQLRNELFFKKIGKRFDWKVNLTGNGS
ncbi:heparan sulfate glucosamine 3-O-sulfotransferase 1-like isoform X2 [Watersipora subatra]|uniref:heparan sulfate glucosamine 3-O-sulfotransferase 1-like isoform X2 n=1 Tax=Watersipora subatra TaxID=2589382 RepID=UPI00355C615C